MHNFSYHINLFQNNLPYASYKKNSYVFFLDRDGVIIKDKNYISNPDDVDLELGVIDFLRYLYESKIPVIIVTNQSGIFREIFNWDQYEKVNDRMLELIGPYNPILGIFANGLPPNASLNSWRKPSPDMILFASNLLKLSLSNSFLIGDKLIDIQSGVNAGIKNLIHVETGYGIKEKSKVKIFRNDFYKKNKKLNKFTNFYFLKDLNQYKSFLKNE